MGSLTSFFTFKQDECEPDDFTGDVLVLSANEALSVQGIQDDQTIFGKGTFLPFIFPTSRFSMGSVLEIYLAAHVLPFSFARLTLPPLKIL